MTTKRIDQLTAHPQSMAQPLNLRINDVVAPIRDPSLASDNTRQIAVRDLAPFPDTNVLNFGADPNGLSDSTAAIQAAIDSAVTPRVVYIPPGQYLITGTLYIPEGVWLKGAGIFATIIRMLDGIGGFDAIQQKPSTVSAHYIHATIISDLTLRKGSGNGGVFMQDRVGAGIFFDSNCGEGTKFQNLRIQGFPEGGIWINGAITCWFQDIEVVGSGIPEENFVGYGIRLRNKSGNSFTGHYLLGISGDACYPALIGAENANVWIAGVKNEVCRHTVELTGTTATRNWCILSNVTHSFFAPTSGLTSVAHVVSKYSVWINGVSIHTGAVPPDYLIRDDSNSTTVPYIGGLQILSYYSSRWGGEIFHLDDSVGGYLRIGDDPPILTSGPPNHFALGHTNGDGTSGATNIQGKSGGPTAPANLTVNKWVRAQLDGVNGWVPFFT